MEMLEIINEINTNNKLIFHESISNHLNVWDIVNGSNDYNFSDKTFDTLGSDYSFDIKNGTLTQLSASTFSIDETDNKNDIEKMNDISDEDNNNKSCDGAGKICDINDIIVTELYIKRKCDKLRNDAIGIDIDKRENKGTRCIST